MVRYFDLPHFDLLTLCGRRKLNNTERANYIKAVKCLQARPPLYQNIAAVRTRFDEFQALHIDVADRVHTTVNLRYCFHQRRRGLRDIPFFSRVISCLGIDVL